MNSAQSDRTVVVTAGGANIGLAIADSFIAAGDRVYVCDVSGQSIEAARTTRPMLLGRIADVSQPEEVEAFFAWVTADSGGVDVLVNNAGIAGPRGAVETLDYEDWRRTVEVNLNGIFYCVRQVVPQMKTRRRGVILNISTSSARTGLPNRAPYVASKAGVLGLTYNLARELGPWGIRCNAILPGPMDTPRGRQLVAARAQDLRVDLLTAEREKLRFTSLRDWVQPSEVGATAVYLASDAARHISGQMLGVCSNTEWEA